MPKGTLVASLNVIVKILNDPDWAKRARKVKTLKEMRRLILDFCEFNGKIVSIDGETLCT